MTDLLLYSDIDEICANLPIAALNALAGKHILMTGGRGFLGRYFTAVFDRLNRRYLSSPVRVTVLDNFVSSGPDGARLPTLLHVAFVNHDVTSPYQDHDPVDFIIHAAGIASPAHYKARPLETLDVAVTGLRNSLELARKNAGCRLVFFSSSEIYGDPTEGNVPTPETYRGHVASLGPRACYDESKRLGETLVQIYQQQYGVHGCIVRPFNVYGPGMQRGDYRVLPNFAARIVDGKPLEVYGSGKQTRTFCYVTDAIGGFLRVLLFGRAGEPYNIGNPEPEIGMFDLAQRCADIVSDYSLGGHVQQVTRVSYPDNYPADEPNRRCPDIRKAGAHLGYVPRVSLDEGLRRFFGWAREAFVREDKAA